MRSLLIILALSPLAFASVVPRAEDGNATVSVGAIPTCNAPFIQHGLQCFYISTSDDPELNWFDAGAACRSLDPSATLARPYDKDIDDFINGQTSSTDPSNYWTDLTDFLTEEVFTYSNGAVAGYTNWAWGEPDGEHEHCVDYNSYNQQWWNHYCHETFRYICQTSAK